MDLFFYHDVTEFHEVALTPPCFPSRNIMKNSKTYSSPMRDVFIEQPLRQNRGFISSPLSGKNTITFCNIWAIFARKQGGVTSERVRIKIRQNLFHPHSSCQISVKKFCFQHSPVLRLYISKDISEKCWTRFSSLAAFLGTTPTCLKKIC